MIVSRNEVHGVVRKAALGARLPGGTADDLANAASWMEVRGIAALSLALDYIEAGAAADQHIACCFDQIAAGGAPIQLDDANGLLVGFAADAAAAYGLGFVIEWPHARIRVGPKCIVKERQTPDAQTLSGPATISACDAPDAVDKVDDITMDSPVWARANEMAAEYYVPATEESRLGGAGAGVNDND